MNDTLGLNDMKMVLLFFFGDGFEDALDKEGRFLEHGGVQRILHDLTHQVIVKDDAIDNALRGASVGRIHKN